MTRQQAAMTDARRRRWLAAGLGLAAAPLLGCGTSDATETPPAGTRRWRMGFSPNPARPTVESVIAGIDVWSRRADMFIIHEQVPWTKLLAGRTPDDILDTDKMALVAYIRSKGPQPFVFMGDLTDGLAREKEAPELLAAGRSITEPAIQALYRDYLLAVDRKLKPDVLGLVAESNLIRLAAPGLYPSVVKAANDTAAALRAAGSSTALLASVQVETAWGVLGGPGSSTYVGIEQDRADFPFIERLGLSSYPYFGWRQPEDLPLDYYSRLLAGRRTPVLVVEGGWASAGAGSISSDPQKQLRYLERQVALLDQVGALAWLFLQFADVDVASVPPPVPANLALFTSIGLADPDLKSKPALATWDALFARRLSA